MARCNRFHVLYSHSLTGHSRLTPDWPVKHAFRLWSSKTFLLTNIFLQSLHENFEVDIFILLLTFSSQKYILSPLLYVHNQNGFTFPTYLPCPAGADSWAGSERPHWFSFWKEGKKATERKRGRCGKRLFEMREQRHLINVLYSLERVHAFGISSAVSPIGSLQMLAVFVCAGWAPFASVEISFGRAFVISFPFVLERQYARDVIDRQARFGSRRLRHVNFIFSG